MPHPNPKQTRFLIINVIARTRIRRQASTPRHLHSSAKATRWARGAWCCWTLPGWRCAGVLSTLPVRSHCFHLTQSHALSPPYLIPRWPTLTTPAPFPLKLLPAHPPPLVAPRAPARARPTPKPYNYIHPPSITPPLPPSHPHAALTHTAPPTTGFHRPRCVKFTGGALRKLSGGEDVRQPAGCSPAISAGAHPSRCGIESRYGIRPRARRELIFAHR